MSHYFSGHYYTADALKSAYRDLCKANHPDRANQRMQEINGEYEILQAQLKRDGVAGWTVPKEVRQDKPHKKVSHDTKQEQHTVDSSPIDYAPRAKAWTWKEKHAESQRAADESLQRELNRMTNVIYGRHDEEPSYYWNTPDQQAQLARMEEANAIQDHHPWWKIW